MLDAAISGFGVEPEEARNLKRWVTPSPAVNRAFGIGGVPLGVFSVVWGPYRGGKTTTMASLLGAVAEDGGIGLYADVERAAYKPWFRSLGAPDNAYVYVGGDKARSQEEFQDTISKFLVQVAKWKKVGDVDPSAPVLVVLDTVTLLVPSEKLSGKIGSRDYGLSANYLNDWLKTVTILADDANAHICLVSQERKDREGIWTGGQTPGSMYPAYRKHRPTTGDSILFSASVGLRIEASATTKEGEKKVGKRHTIRVLKSKMGPDIVSGGAPIPVFFTSTGAGECPVGLDRVRELIYAALDLGVLRKPAGKARWEATYDDSLAWAGEKRLRNALREDEILRAGLWLKTQEAIEAVAVSHGYVP